MNQQTSTGRRRATATLSLHALAVVAVLVLAVSGCSGGNPVFAPTITQQQASARVQQLLQGTAAALSPRPRLETYKPGSYVGGCLIDPADTADKRVMVTHRYWLRDITQHDNVSIGEQVLQLWKHKGYTIDSTLDIGSNAPEVHGTTQDNFLIALEWSDNGALSIVATSPCVWPDGTPPPGH